MSEYGAREVALIHKPVTAALESTRHRGLCQSAEIGPIAQPFLPDIQYSRVRSANAVICFHQDLLWTHWPAASTSLLVFTSFNFNKRRYTASYILVLGDLASTDLYQTAYIGQG